jgi:hypothetical protein
MKAKAELLALSNQEIQAFGATLTTTNHLKMTEADIQKISDFVCADGCTGVTQIYKPACIIHDFYYMTHRDFEGKPINKAEADKRFRQVLQRLSFFGILSPMSWWRWAGVGVFGHMFWDKK